MNWRSSALWGFVGTVFLSGLMSGSQGMGLTRMSLPFMLGTMFTPDRDRAKLVGTGVHLLNGWLLAARSSGPFTVCVDPVRPQPAPTLRGGPHVRRTTSSVGR